MSDQSQQDEGNATGLFNGLPQHETFTVCLAVLIQAPYWS